MLAGFAKVCINPPLGGPMLGWGRRDVVDGIRGVHDDLFVRALAVEHEGQRALIIAYDLLFFDRGDGDRLKGAIGAALDLAPRQILLNCSHTHDGPALGSWGHAAYDHQPDPLYLDELVAATVAAARQATAAQREVTLWAGETRSRLAVSRRRVNPDGAAVWGPDPEGEVLDALPLAMLRDSAGDPVCLLFSVSCHPSTTQAWEISADYPGVACDLLGAHLGADVALFLQGCGGDAKACVIADGDGGLSFRQGDWDDITAAGQVVADEVIGGLPKLAEVKPGIRTALTETAWPLAPAPSRAELEQVAKGEDRLRRLWAQRQLARLDRGQSLVTAASVQLQLLALSPDLRLIALEGEPVAGIGHLMRAGWSHGVTFALGYTNGQGLYLPTERMLPEGGYEVTSAYEYGWPAGLAPGYEAELRAAVAALA